MNSTQHALPANVAREDNKRLALQLRIGGATYAQIGEQIEVSTSTAHLLVIEALEELKEKTAESAEQLRTLEVTRLDDMLASLNTGKDRNSARVMDTKLRIMERRAKLLGLDAPQEFSGPGGGPIPIAAVDSRDLLKQKIDAVQKQLAAGVPPAAAAQAVIAASNGDQPVTVAVVEVVPPPTEPPSTNGDTPHA